ncbi:MAG: lipid IV(A) 3-deoxy-D-manno-octulosonic acid transferase [Methylotetracoccus sp.]|nr:lipid IV(A) 3-deoxy-D-manno-octulosonic acid transferase [Methylotetracoccus sp.]
MRLLYTLLFYAATPFILARVFWRGRWNPAYRQRIPERFGFYGGEGGRRETAWVHAVSVGEVESAIPLVRSLLELRPGLSVLFTSTTPTGSARVQATLGDRVQHCYLPYDLPGCVNRFLRHFQPRIAVILETELWPNLFAACAAHSIPLFIVNGRLSARSTDGYRRLASLVKDTLTHVTAIAAQTDEDASRFVAIGAARNKVMTCGNIKFDLEVRDDFSEQGMRDRQLLFGGDRPVLIAASTHEGEEQLLLAVYATLLTQFPRLALILVPRHPERFPSVAALCRNCGYSVVQRSEGRTCSSEDQIFLVDTMGELRRFYAAADLAFVGGSLVPVGGHNVLEPAAVGTPVLFGPYMENFREICLALSAAGGALPCENTAALERHCASLLANAEQRTAMGGCGRSFVAANRGALARILSVLGGYLPAAAAAANSTSASSSNGAGRPIK